MNENRVRLKIAAAEASHRNGKRNRSSYGSDGAHQVHTRTEKIEAKKHLAHHHHGCYNHHMVTRRENDFLSLSSFPLHATAKWRQMEDHKWTNARQTWGRRWTWEILLPEVSCPNRQSISYSRSMRDTSTGMATPPSTAIPTTSGGRRDRY